MSKSIAERIEALEVGNRAVDWEIHCRNGLDGVGGYGAHPRYTASLDAAMTLVPERWVWSINQFPDKASAYCVSEDGVIARPRKQYQATPALALCAAALRAQEATNG